jgi:hypothetical protein
MNYSTFVSNDHAHVGNPSDRKPWSKKVTKRRRRSATKDRKALELTRISAHEAISSTDAPLVTNNTPSNDNLETQKAAKIHAWEHSTNTGKVTTAIRVLEAAGKGYAWTLDLSPDEIKAANDNAKGFTDYFKRRISRALYRVLGYVPDYLLTVGVAARDRLHLHGAIEANGNQLEAIRGALEHAGGVWDHTHHKRRQCDLQSLYTPDVWSRYCLRHGPKARRLIEGPAVSITTRLRRRARGYWRQSRISYRNKWLTNC